MAAPSQEAGTISGLAAEVFAKVMEGLTGRTGDLARLVEAGYSFDEWLVWEAFLACAGVPGWQVSPRPAYASLGVHGDADFGDLLVRRGEESVVVELGLVHDYSGDLFARRLEADAHKLSGPFAPGVTPLQLVLCASSRDLLADPSWGEWLSRFALWNREPFLEHALSLPPQGSLVARAWS